MLASADLPVTGSTASEEISSSLAPQDPPAAPESPKSGRSLTTPTASVRPFSRYAIGVKASTLGAGLEVATVLTRSLNLRAAFNYLEYSPTLVEDGTNYNAQLLLRNGELMVDWFPFHNSFHVSPGLLVQNNKLNALLYVPGGNTFSLGDADYVSDPSNPIHGTGALSYRHRAAPMLMLGFGNILPRSGRHFAVPFEFGAAYTERPDILLNFAGGACETVQGHTGCGDIQQQPEFQADLDAETKKLQDNLSAIRFYPIVSIGVAYSF